LLRADDVGPEVVSDVASLVLIAVGERRSTWRRPNLYAEAARQTMGWRFATTTDRDAITGMVVDAAELASLRLTPPSPPKGQHLTSEQAQAAATVATDARQLALLVGPAGAGKTTAMRSLKRMWIRQHGRSSVVGLAPSAAAAQGLADELGIDCENTAKVALRTHPGRAAFTTDQLVVIDEATLAGTLILDRITDHTVKAGEGSARGRLGAAPVRADRGSVRDAGAVTAHRAQGLTVDTAHVVAAQTTTRENLYVAMTRGRESNIANVALGLPVDARDYGVGAQILAALGVRRMRLVTNNPVKRVGLEAHGLEITDTVRIPIRSTPHNLAYLRTKPDRMGHDLTALEDDPACDGDSRCGPGPSAQ